MKLPWSRPANNSLGVAGLIVSIAGFFTCGLLSPIGLLLSLAGLLKAPRGAALAGSVLGLFGSGLFVLMTMSMLASLITGRPLGPSGDREGTERRAVGGLGGNEIESLDGLPADVEVGWATFRSSRFGQGVTRIGSNSERRIGPGRSFASWNVWRYSGARRRESGRWSTRSN
jgi:hypothetical protein